MIGIITLLGLCMGCGGSSTTQSSPPPTSTSSTTNDHFNPLGDLLGQAQAALQELEDPSPHAEAVSRFVIFTTKTLPQTDAVFESLVSAHFSLTNQVLQAHKVSKLAISKLSDRFSVTHLSTQNELPINLEAFAGAAQHHKLSLQSITGLTFVSYQGRALKRGLQINVICKVTSRLTTSPSLREITRGGVWIGSLSTLEILDVAEFAQRCDSSQEHWIRPGAELVDHEVRMISRGLNQWGRPELELGPLPKDQAPKQFPHFMKAIETMRSGPFPQGKLIKHKLSNCLRPPHHYETSCRRLTW